VCAQEWKQWWWCQAKLRCRLSLRNGKHEFDSALHAEKRNQIWTFYYGRWITKDGLVDAYDTINGSLWISATESMNLVEKIKITMLFNRTNVQQKHGNWKLTKKLFLLLYQKKGDPIIFQRWGVYECKMDRIPTLSAVLQRTVPVTAANAINQQWWCCC
jgi:hypothetical protein